MAQTFRDLSIVEPGTNPFDGTDLTGVVTAGCCQGVGDRVFQYEKSTTTDVQFISTARLATGDYVIKFRAFPRANDDSVGFIFWRTDENNYYELRLGHIELNTASINRVVNGVATEIVADTTITALAGKVAYVRIKLTASTQQIQVRAWLATVIEPTTWGITHTSTLAIAETATMFGFSQAAARSADWHWITSSDVATEVAYKARIPANDTTVYPGGNLSVSGAAYYHIDDPDGRGVPAVSTTARVYDQRTGVFVSRGKTTDASARFNISDLKTADNCYATFSPTNVDSTLQTGIVNLLMPALATTTPHTVPGGAPSALPGTYFIIHLRDDASNLARVGKTDGSNFAASDLIRLGDQLQAYLGFDNSGALSLGTWTVTNLATNKVGDRYQLVYVDRALVDAEIVGTATYDDRVMYANLTRAVVSATLSAQQQASIRQLITTQSSVLLDGLVECFLALGAERTSVAPDTVNLTTANSVTLANADTLVANGCSAVLVSGYDPLIIDDDNVLALTAGTSGSPLTSAQRLEFVLSNNGVPSSTTIYLGHISGAVLLAKSAASPTLATSIIVSQLSSIGDIDHLKRVIEAASGAKQIDQQSFSGLAHTVFYEGSETTPPNSFNPNIKAGSICIKASSNQIFYRSKLSPSVNARRDEIQFTTGINGYRIGEIGTATRVPNDLLGFFFRGGTGARTNYTMGLREDVLPSGIGTTFQARFATGTSTPTGTWITFTRTRSVNQINGHKYFYYGSPVGTTEALTANSPYTMQFRSTASGNPPINIWPASTETVGPWVALAGGTGGGGATALTGLTDVSITSPTDGQGILYEASSSMWKNKDLPSGGSGGTTINVDKTLKESGTDPKTLGIADSVISKIDEAYDTVRLINDEFTITPTVSGGEIGWRTSGLGSIDPTGDPTFTDGTNTWRVTEIQQGTAAGDRFLEIHVSGSPAVTTDEANIPTLPSEVDFKIGDRTFRGRDANVQYFDADTAISREAYAQYLFPNTAVLFTAGTDVTCQVLSKGESVNRLLPRGGRIGDFLGNSALDTPAWESLARVAITKIRPCQLPFLRSHDVSLPDTTAETGINLLQNLVVDGDILYAFGGIINSRGLNKITRFQLPHLTVIGSQFGVTPTNPDIVEGFIHSSEYYSLRTTTRSTAAKVFDRWRLSNWGYTNTTRTITNTDRLGTIVNANWSVTSNDTHYWITNGNGTSNCYLKSTGAYVSARNITPADTTRTIACTAIDGDTFYLLYDDTTDSSARIIRGEAYSTDDGGRDATCDFSVVMPTSGEFSGFRTYGGADIWNSELFLVSNRAVSGRTYIRAWARETSNRHIAEVARDAVGEALTDGDDSSVAEIAFSTDDANETIRATIKPGVIEVDDIKKDTTNTTQAAELSRWKTLFDIGAGGGGGASNLTGLNDVTITSPTNDQAILYETATSLWKNKTLPNIGNALFHSVSTRTNRSITLSPTTDTDLETVTIPVPASTAVSSPNSEVQVFHIFTVTALTRTVTTQSITTLRLDFVAGTETVTTAFLRPGLSAGVASAPATFAGDAIMGSNTNYSIRIRRGTRTAETLSISYTSTALVLPSPTYIFNTLRDARGFDYNAFADISTYRLRAQSQDLSRTNSGGGLDRYWRIGATGLSNLQNVYYATGDFDAKLFARLLNAKVSTGTASIRLAVAPFIPGQTFPSRYYGRSDAISLTTTATNFDLKIDMEALPSNAIGYNVYFTFTQSSTATFTCDESTYNVYLLPS